MSPFDISIKVNDLQQKATNPTGLARLMRQPASTEVHRLMFANWYNAQLAENAQALAIRPVDARNL